MPSRSATAWLLALLAQASTIRQRTANAWLDLARRGPALQGGSFVIGQRQLGQLRPAAAGWGVGLQSPSPDPTNQQSITDSGAKCTDDASV